MDEEFIYVTCPHCKQVVILYVEENEKVVYCTKCNNKFVFKIKWVPLVSDVYVMQRIECGERIKVVSEEAESEV